MEEKGCEREMDGTSRKFNEGNAKQEGSQGRPFLFFYFFFYRAYLHTEPYFAIHGICVTLNLLISRNQSATSLPWSGILVFQNVAV